MATIIARRKHEDGRYYYGSSTVAAPQLGPLFGIRAEGSGDLPEGPNNPATAEEHERWLQSLRSNGFSVEVFPIEEPATESAPLKPTQIRMSGTATFNTFSYLLNGADSLAQTAKEHTPGSNYCRVSAVVFSAFAIEAHLNHIGEAKLSFWGIVEPKLPWRAKLDLILEQLGIIADFGKPPFQTLCDLFKFRDRLAHGKTTTEDKSYRYRGDRENDFGSLDPAWLEKFWSDDAVDRVLKDTQQIIELVHGKAGLESHSLDLIGSGSFSEDGA
jgi:hypothetical protein